MLELVSGDAYHVTFFEIGALPILVFTFKYVRIKPMDKIKPGGVLVRIKNYYVGCTR